MKKSLGRALLLVSTVLGAAAPSVAQAQDRAAQAQNAGDEIVVTARRREENQQDVPLAVSVLGSAALERQNITDLSELQGSVPNLVISPNGNATLPSFAIRGLQQQEATHLADPSVSLYINDVVLARPWASNVALYDIQSVQVLRGPQGTLFGRNTTGGAVVVTTATPTSEFDARISQSVADFNTYATQAMVNVPLGDVFSLRIAGQHRESEGYITDRLNGRDLDSRDEDALRVTASFDLTPSFSTIFTTEFATVENGGGGIFAKPGAIGAPSAAALDEFNPSNGTPQHANADTFMFTNRTTWDLSDSVTVRNIASYRELQVDEFYDTDGGPAFVLPIQRIVDQSQFSNELQVLGDASWGNWIAGAYYFHETGDDQGLSSGIFGGCGATPQNFAFTDLRQYACYSNTWSTAENTSTAIFAQASVNLPIENLTLTVGARQNWDDRSAVIQNRTATACRFTVDHDNNPATAEVNPGLAGCALPLSASFSEPTYNVSLEYAVSDDVLFYLAHRHGYRTGGFGARAGTEAGLSRTFTPEIVDDIEIGAKADWRVGDWFVRTNLAAFYADYSDIQRLLSDPAFTPVQTVTTNAGQAEIQGAELEFLVRPNDWLELSGFYAYTDAHFVEFIAPNGADLSGNPFSRAPENISGATVRVMLPVPESIGNMEASVQFFHQDAMSNNDTFIPGVTVTEGYDLVDISFEWNRIFGSGADLQLFGSNVFDNTYSQGVLNLGAATANSAIAGAPQAFGARLAYSFN